MAYKDFPSRILTLSFALLSLNGCAQFGASLHSPEPIASAFYKCTDARWVKADFFETPVPYVALQLSDGRKLNLSQVHSASGVRFADVVETIEFRNQGNSCYIHEAPLGELGEITFDNCEDKS
jgi:membrane-bound inhibitor of C-type lysozyme